MATAQSDDTAARLSQALARLGPALELLEGFQRRNKNQHRVAKWWAQFDMLRRALRKLVWDINAEIDKREKQRRPKKPRTGAGEGIGGAVDTRITHLRAQIVPRAYLAFSQLTADKQFAQLGLVLLGVLAQVDDTTRMLAPDVAVREPSPRAVDAGARSRAGDSEAEAMPVSKTEFGVPVARAEVAEVGHQSGNSEGHVVLVAKPEEADKLGKRSKKRNELDDIFVSLLPEKNPKKKKKKKDEFDDIFKSLI